MSDNSDLRQKVAVRHEALKKLGRKPELVIEYYAGHGVMTKLIWSIASDKVISIEKEVDKAANNINSSQVIVGDNKDYIHLANDACIIDCDAYGLVMPFIAKLPKGKIVVFTDGSLERAKFIRKELVNFRKSLNAIFSKHSYVANDTDTAFYGWGITK